jgi:hypothetical protein
VAVYAGICTAFQFWLPGPLDADTAYHLAVARLMREHGILHSFPWVTFSWLNENYGDKEFLFHLLLVPLAPVRLEVASAVIGAVLETVILAVIYLVLRQERVRWAGVWALAPVATVAFLYRFAMVRPHLLSIALAVVLAYAMARQRGVLTFVAAVLYPLSYVASWQIALLTTVALVASHLLAGSRPTLRPVVLCLAGLAVGFFLHPNTANVLRFNWVVMKDILLPAALDTTSVRNLGTEFQALTVGGWLRNYALMSVLSVTAAWLAFRARREDVAPLVFAVLALEFGALTWVSIRFVEYQVPFTVVAFALATRNVRRPWLAPAVLAASALYSAFFMDGHLRNLRKPKDWIDPGVDGILQAHVPVGAQVFNCEWELTGYLMLALPERRFMVALDPTLFHLKDPVRFRSWYSLPRGRDPESAEIVRRAFQARYVICQQGHAHSGFLGALLADPNASVSYISKKLILVDLGGPEGNKPVRP